MLSTARVVSAIRHLVGSEKVASKGRPIRVLVVDDEPTVCTFVTRVLGEAGYQTSSAGGGSEALTGGGAVRSVRLLLTDLKMPDMNGDELARQLRLDDPRLKVLYFTGFSDQLFKDRLSALGR